jgi:thiosulfate dehydrogenase [quinone] large subunit
MPKALILYFRFVMAWTFLYAASHQVFVPGWTIVGFLNHTKTFHDFFAIFTTPTMAPITTFLVEYGHLLIGLSLLIGLMVLVSAAFGVVLMIILLVRAHGLAVHREHEQLHCRLSPGLQAC